VVKAGAIEAGIQRTLGKIVKLSHLDGNQESLLETECLTHQTRKLISCQDFTPRNVIPSGKTLLERKHNCPSQIIHENWASLLINKDLHGLAALELLDQTR